MRAEQRAGNKGEAAERAKEYLGKYPNGSCRDEATRIQSGDAADDADPPSNDVPAPSVSATSSAASTPSAPAPKP